LGLFQDTAEPEPKKVKSEQPEEAKGASDVYFREGEGEEEEEEEKKDTPPKVKTCWFPSQELFQRCK